MNRSFKPGDKVRLVEINGSDEAYGFKIGETYIMTDERDSEGGSFRLPGHARRYMFDRQFELAGEPKSHTFKVGDKVRIVLSDGYHHFKVGDICTKEREFSDSFRRDSDGATQYLLPRHWRRLDGATYCAGTDLSNNPTRLVKSGSADLSSIKLSMADKPKERSLMTRLSAMAKKTFDGDTKTLIKAEYLNKCLDVTSEGQDALWPILFEAHKKELVAAAKADIKEREEECKDCE